MQLIGMWFLFLGIAVANGGIREKYVEIQLGELAAHQLSTLILSLAIFICTTIFIKYKNLTDNKTLLLTGLFWSVLTITFEFVFFHAVGGKPWSALIAEYNIFEGRIFSLVIITIILSPIISSKLFIKT